MKKIICLILSAVLLMSVPAFTYAEANENGIILLLKDLNIANGDPDGNMRLFDAVSRAEFTKMAIATSSFKNSASSALVVSPFKDVPYTHWAASYVRLAAKNGILKGYPDATFKPDGEIYYEEALTIMLKVLGYTDDDFNDSYPDGQVALAVSLDLTDGIDKTVGSRMTRQDVIYLIYNSLKTKIKGSNNSLISIFEATLTEDVTIISTSSENSVLADDKIVTTAGTYKINSSFDRSNVGKEGELIVKNNGNIVAFIPKEQSDMEKYVVYSMNSEGLITIYENSMKQLDISDGTVCYDKDSTRSVFSAVKSSLEMGDIVYAKYNKNGSIDYLTVAKGSLTGPVTASSAIDIDGVTEKTLTVRNGAKTTVNSVQPKDILYYSKDLDMLFAYTKKITGIYENALPNKEAPSSVVISGTAYSLEGAVAFDKLSSIGNINYGDSITAMLGLSGKIADVELTGAEYTEDLYGYVDSTGAKQFTTNNNSYTGFYANIICSDGSVKEYITQKDYSNYENKMVRIEFTGGKAKLYTVNSASAVKGIVSYKDKTIGDTALSGNIEIVDIIGFGQNYTGYAKTYLQRIDGLTLSANNIIYAGKNKSGEINSLFLNNVTGDGYSYGIITRATNSSSANAVFSSYSILENATVNTYSSSNTSYGIDAHHPVKLLVKNGQINTMQALLKADGVVKSISKTQLSTQTNTYPISDKATVYYKNSDLDYTVLPIDDIMNNEYNLTAYYDKSVRTGGKIRIIIATDK